MAASNLLMNFHPRLQVPDSKEWKGTLWKVKEGTGIQGSGRGQPHPMKAIQMKMNGRPLTPDVVEEVSIKQDLNTEYYRSIRIVPMFLYIDNGTFYVLMIYCESSLIVG